MRHNPLLMTVMGNPARKYRANPFILIDSGSNKIIRMWRGSMLDKKPWDWAKDAARRLGRNVYVVAHPYIPATFRPGVEVSSIFFMMGPYAVVDPGGRIVSTKQNPGIIPSVVGGVAGSIVANALSNPRGPRTHKGAEKILDDAIGHAWQHLMSGVQVPIMDIPRIFRDIKLEIAAGADLLTAVQVVGTRYRVNPLTRREAADTLRSSRRDLAYAARPAKSKADRDARRFYAGRAVGKAWVAKMHGPDRAEHPGAEAAFRRGYRHGMSKNPGMTRRKVTMPIEKFAKLIKAKNDPKLWADFVKKVRGYHKWTHGTWPKKVTIEVIRKPGVSGIWIAYAMGKQPESTYMMPKGSKRKGAWKHPWTRMPEMKGDPEAGIILTKLRGGNRLTDFLHG